MIASYLVLAPAHASTVMDTPTSSKKKRWILELIRRREANTSHRGLEEWGADPGSTN
jgi:hypothetical protein